MKLNYKNSKKIGTILGIVLFIGLIAGITYAVFNWRSTNTNISVNTKCFQVEGSSSYTVQGSNMLLFDEDDIIDEENGTITYKNGMLYYPFTISRDSSCNSDIHYEIIVHITELSEDYRNGALKYKVIGDMSSYTSQQIANPLNESLSYNHFGGSLLNTGDHTIYQMNISPNTSITPAVVFYLDGDLVPENASDLTLSASIEVVANQGQLEETAAEYIKFLYDGVPKTTATVNSITYNLAPSVNLMNDRHASMSTDINGGDIRYYGPNPNNYVWLGDTYSTSYTFPYGGVYKTRNAGEKKLWRVIGVFDGRLKLVSNDPISNIGLSWDTSPSATGGNSGYGINEWSQADIMKLLNPGFESNQDLDTSGNTITVNNSLYWNKGIGTVYTSSKNETTNDVSFAATGLSSGEKNMIVTATWYLGAYNGSASYVDVQYAAERQGDILGKICSSGSLCNDNVVRTATWNGKVGLIYPSDYGYAVDFSVCSSNLNDFSGCQGTDWLTDFTGDFWTISSSASSSSAYSVYYASNNSPTVRVYSVSYVQSYVNNTIYSSVYIDSDVVITGGSGVESDPYVLHLD